jgi:hypothetical protein
LTNGQSNRVFLALKAESILGLVFAASDVQDARDAAKWRTKMGAAACDGLSRLA